MAPPSLAVAPPWIHVMLYKLNSQSTSSFLFFSFFITKKKRKKKREKNVLEEFARHIYKISQKNWFKVFDNDI